MESMCPVCGKVGSFRCGKCKLVNYCGRECQTVHFKTHKHTCRNPPELGEPQHNLFTSLPSSLMCVIMNEWVEPKSLAKLDLAFCNRGNRSQLLETLRSEEFTISHLYPLESSMSDPDPSKPTSDTKRLQWLLLRDVKVKEFDFAYGCDATVMTKYLKNFGMHVQRVTHYTPTRFPSGAPISSGQFNIFAMAGVPGTYASGPRPGAQSQSSVIAKYCRNLTSYFCRMLNNGDAGFLRVLKNNPGLQVLHIEGDLCGIGNAAPFSSIQLPNLHQLLFQVKWGFDDVLLAIVKTAPLLQKLIACNPSKCTEIDHKLILDVARACPQLRSFSCRELDLGPEDCALQHMLQLCPKIVNLDLHMHQNLTDSIVISALACLPALHSIDLSYCTQLTDRTLHFLRDRFAHKLQVLYIGGSGGMTEGGVKALRAACSRLHTFHCCLELEGVGEEVPLNSQMTTIVKVYYDEDMSVIAKHCANLEVLDMSGSFQVSEESLMEVSLHCPKLHTVVVNNTYYSDGKLQFPNVEKAFPRLVFTLDGSLGVFDVLKMPV